jgi:hypothetical protein
VRRIAWRHRETVVPVDLRQLLAGTLFALITIMGPSDGDIAAKPRVDGGGVVSAGPDLNLGGAKFR